MSDCKPEPIFLRIIEPAHFRTVLQTVKTVVSTFGLALYWATGLQLPNQEQC
ncbi:MAG: hypothetical protein KME27_08960 [Lyngbya sp. HA4199-MV5]|nr:hypothetical protein [Lyngbya sp. HA4199-MV5]